MKPLVMSQKSRVFFGSCVTGHGLYSTKIDLKNLTIKWHEIALDMCDMIQSNVACQQ